MASEKTTLFIFLDIDGVILPFGHGEETENENLFPNETMRNFSTILEGCRQNPMLELRTILSSTWRVEERYRKSIEDEFRRFSETAAVMGKTNATSAGSSQQEHPLSHFQFWDFTDIRIHSTRQFEIYEYLRSETERQLAEGKRRSFLWIALDDEELIRGPMNDKYARLFAGHVVQTESHLGITREDAEKAIELVRNQWNNFKR